MQPGAAGGECCSTLQVQEACKPWEGWHYMQGFFFQVLGWVFFSGELCKAALDPAGRLLAAGLKCLLGLRGLVGPSVALPAKGFC